MVPFKKVICINNYLYPMINNVYGYGCDEITIGKMYDVAEVHPNHTGTYELIDDNGRKRNIYHFLFRHLTVDENREELLKEILG